MYLVDGLLGEGSGQLRYGDQVWRLIFLTTLVHWQLHKRQHTVIAEVCTNGARINSIFDKPGALLTMHYLRGLPDLVSRS